MKLMNLENSVCSDENLYKIIQFVIDFEKERGLSELEIQEKYLHGYCSSLVEIIKHFLPKAHIVGFLSYDEFSHFCIRLYEEGKIYYYDINGAKSYNEMMEFIAKEFGGNPKNIFLKDFDEIHRENDIIDQIYNLIKLPEEQFSI